MALKGFARSGLMLFSLVLLAAPVLALPGQREAELRQWLAGHDFLLGDSPLADPARPGVYAVGRPLSHGRMLLFEFWLGQNRQVLGETLLLEVPAGAPDPLNLFDRQNPTALDLLSKLYGAEIANDFRQARFVYDGYKYYAQDRPTARSAPLAQPQRKSLFLGKYGYLVSYSPVGDDGKARWQLQLATPQLARGIVSPLEAEKRLYLKHRPAAEQATERARQQALNQALLDRRQLPSNLDLSPAMLE